MQRKNGICDAMNKEVYQSNCWHQILLYTTCYNVPLHIFLTLASELLMELLLGKFSRHAKYYTTGKMQGLRKFTLFWILISKGRRVFESLWAEHLFSYHISKHLTFRAEQSIGDQPSNWGVKTSKASSCIWKHITTITERKQLYLLS